MVYGFIIIIFTSDFTLSAHDSILGSRVGCGDKKVIETTEKFSLFVLLRKHLEAHWFHCFPTVSYGS